MNTDSKLTDLPKVEIQKEIHCSKVASLPRLIRYQYHCSKSKSFCSAIKQLFEGSSKDISSKYFFLIRAFSKSHGKHKKLHEVLFKDLQSIFTGVQQDHTIDICLFNETLVAQSSLDEEGRSLFRPLEGDKRYKQPGFGGRTVLSSHS